MSFESTMHFFIFTPPKNPKILKCAGLISENYLKNAPKQCEKSPNISGKWMKNSFQKCTKKDMFSLEYFTPVFIKIFQPYLQYFHLSEDTAKICNIKNFAIISDILSVWNVISAASHSLWREFCHYLRYFTPVFIQIFRHYLRYFHLAVETTQICNLKNFAIVSDIFGLP